MLHEPKTKETRRKLHQSISIRLLKTRDKEKNLKSGQKNRTSYIQKNIRKDDSRLLVRNNSNSKAPILK